MALTALFLGSPSVAPAAVVARWLAGGNRIAAFWTADGHDNLWGYDRRLARVAPQWSIGRQLEAAEVPVVRVPRLAGWSDGPRFAREMGADVLISAYFHHVIPSAILDIFPGRAFNIHPSLLPRYRGPTPLQGMILDRATDAAGATLHLLDATLDTGAIVAQTPVAFPVKPPATGYAIALAHAAAGLVDHIPAFLQGRIEARTQDEAAASYVKVVPAKAFVVSSDLSADEVAWRCGMMPYFRPPAIRELPGRDAIGFDRVLGPRTGAAPRARWFSGDFDAADQRVRVRLRWNGWRRMDRWRFFWLLRQSPVVLKAPEVTARAP
ncbi:formyltransferase family protein [Kaistia terrae]|uniref:Formyltransferase family protein n=1 Tax=Kaistia terrae TaxID=537017 RepID=A0ABW0PUR8_9HYPH|nr:formyltransferase family protein [Kaistia terrae]MCX5579608.1 formyltransferase family protein [Kaistia terrae]